LLPITRSSAALDGTQRPGTLSKPALVFSEQMRWLSASCWDSGTHHYMRHSNRNRISNFVDDEELQAVRGHGVSSRAPPLPVSGTIPRTGLGVGTGVQMALPAPMAKICITSAPRSGTRSNFPVGSRSVKWGWVHSFGGDQGLGQPYRKSRVEEL